MHQCFLFYFEALRSPTSCIVPSCLITLISPTCLIVSPLLCIKVLWSSLSLSGHLRFTSVSMPVFQSVFPCVAMLCVPLPLSCVPGPFGLVCSIFFPLFWSLPWTALSSVLVVPSKLTKLHQKPYRQKTWHPYLLRFYYWLHCTSLIALE